jgi:quercetin dioxygenase-like cupin family protein
MLSTITIIPRTEIQLVTEITEDGETHSLGEQRDFRRNPVLAKFLSEQARLAIAWVRLGAGQVLEPHRHPVRSMILVCQGRGVVLDQVEIPLVEGDAVLVPAGYLHGFKGLEPDGVAGLSIQFDDRGLYEDVEHPQVAFVPR